MKDQPLVLVVDDHEDVRLTTAFVLRRFDFRVEEAENGFEAIAKASRLSPDVVLLDIGMPGIDGFETARRLKADSKTSAIPIIAVTALGQSEFREKARESGFDSYLVKPVFPQALVAEIRRFLDRPGGPPGR